MFLVAISYQLIFLHKYCLPIYEIHLQTAIQSFNFGLAMLIFKYNAYQIKSLSEFFQKSLFLQHIHDYYSLNLTLSHKNKKF